MHIFLQQASSKKFHNSLYGGCNVNMKSVQIFENSYLFIVIRFLIYDLHTLHNFTHLSMMVQLFYQNLITIKRYEFSKIWTLFTLTLQPL